MNVSTKSDAEAEAALAEFLATPTPKMALADLSLYHKNPRKGDVELLKGSLLENTQYKPVTVNVGTLTGRPYEVLAGNHTVIAAREVGWHEVLVHFVDVDDVAAAKIVAIDNRSGDKGKYDEEILGELLSSIPDLEGTGYTTEELEKLLGNNVIEGDADTTAESRVFGVIVECETEAQQVALIDQLEGEGFTTRALM